MAEQVNKSSFHLPPSFEHFGGPWHTRAHSRLYSSRTVDANFDRIFDYRIQGLNTTVSNFLSIFIL
jgi:hypothetical protein